MSNDSSVLTRARAIIAQLSLEEKVSQMLNAAPAIPHAGIPAYDWWSEALHGYARAGLATVFPQAIARAATFDEALEREIGDAVSTEARAKFNLFQKKNVYHTYTGLTLWSPNVNMFRDARWGRGQETFGEDPLLSGRMGAAYVKGLQGDDPKFLKTAACAKHFAVHSGPEAERHGFDAVVSERTLREYYLPAFEHIVKTAHVESVMSAYNAVNHEPCSANTHLLCDILRNEWKFEGHVVSDCGALDDILYGHKAADCPRKAAALALEAGCDLCCSQFYAHLVEAVRKGNVPEALVDRALERLFATRIRLGILDQREPTPWDNLGADDVCTPANRALALKCAEEAVVLVKNNGVLPLSRDKVKAMGVYGPLAMEERALLGNYNGLTDRPSTLLSGLLHAAGPSIPFVQDRRPQLLGDEVVPAWNIGDVKAVAQGDPSTMPMVVCVGLVPFLEGEEGETIPPFCGDRTAIEFPAAQLALARQFKEWGHPVIAVVCGGSPLNLAPLEEICDAVLLAWYPGELGGDAVGNIIFGDVNPSGRLPITYPKSLDDLPPFHDYNLAGHTYRYSTAEPLHPFGFGLSYTSFDYAAPEIEVRDDALAIRTSVTNIGERDGDEVLQIYAVPPAGAVTPPVPRHMLVDFARVHVPRGATIQVERTIPLAALRLWHEDGTPFLAPGTWTLHIGGGQPKHSPTRSAPFTM